MPVFYNIIGRVDPLDRESGVKKYYGVQKMMSTVTPETLAEYIAKRSGRSSGSVISIVNDLLTIIEEYMEQGYNVQLGALGTFQQRILNGWGSATEDTFTPDQIKKITVRFRPGKLLQQKLDTVELRSFNSLKPKESVLP